MIENKWSKDKYLVAILFETIPRKNPKQITIEELRKAMHEDFLSQSKIIKKSLNGEGILLQA